MKRTGTTVRVMTWNIHSGVGTDGHFDLTRVVDTIARHQPDVVALQEVDSRQTPAPARSAFAVLCDAVGGHGIEAKSIITADGAYGQMVVSRWPLGATHGIASEQAVGAHDAGLDCLAGLHDCK